jgi:hypothetical protein
MTVKTGEVDARNFMIDSVEVNLQRGLVGHPTADPVLEAVTNGSSRSRGNTSERCVR